MKALFYFIIPCALFLFPSFSHCQQIVFDPTTLSTLVIQHQQQQSKLKDIAKEEGKIAATQTYITAKLEQIKSIEKKMHERLTKVSAVIRNAKDIVYAADISKDIIKYQDEMIELAKGQPALVIVAAKTEKALIERTADLFLYLATATKDGKVNMLDNAQRTAIIRHVVSELRVMRGLAYSVTRRMRVAARVGVLDYINPFDVSMLNQDAAIVKDLLERKNK